MNRCVMGNDAWTITRGTHKYDNSHYDDNDDDNKCFFSHKFGGRFVRVVYVLCVMVKS